MSFLSKLFSGGGFITGAKAKELIKEKQALLIDVRSKEEWDQGHIEGAKLIPLHDFAGKITQIKKENKPVIVYCRSGGRSSQAMSALQSAGVSEVYNLGPMTNWQV